MVKTYEPVILNFKNTSDVLIVLYILLYYITSHFNIFIINHIFILIIFHVFLLIVKCTWNDTVSFSVCFINKFIIINLLKVC